VIFFQVVAGATLLFPSNSKSFMVTLRYSSHYLTVILAKDPSVQGDLKLHHASTNPTATAKKVTSELVDRADAPLPLVGAGVDV
jgi:hypothetical protein